MTAQTLLDVFEPPEGRVAHSAVLVAMTGAKDFLEDALVRFTGLKARQRAELGLMNTFLLLDAQASAARTTVFSPHELPGLHELQPRDVAAALLHAKLALLAFAPTRTGEPTDVRLAILTSNFTYTCAKHQLELVWVADLALDGAGPARERADVAAAAAFVETLIARRYHLAERGLPPKDRRLTARLDSLLKTCAALAPERTKAGFIHSLDEPLYPQIRQQMKRLRTSAKRNFLLCGSGFYEDPGSKPNKPVVLKKLEELGGFAGKVRRIAIAEPKMAGALAPWARVCANAEWEIVAPHDAHRQDRRALHAKFIYTGWLREGVASNGCLYLGSGNLSRRGLLSAASQAKKESASGHDGVNIECGVVIPVGERLTPEKLAERLFWRDDDAPVEFDEWEPGTSPDEVVHAQIEASPILLARVTDVRDLALQWREGVRDDMFRVRAGVEWIDVKSHQSTLTLAEGDHPDVLHVRSALHATEWVVPIIDASGRACWVPPRFHSYDDALAALLDFPIRPAEASGDDEDSGSDDAEEDAPVNAASGKADDFAKSYALHAAAELLEQTAALQRSLDPRMLDDWFEHMERFFHSSFPPSLIETWRAHRIDVFGHLARTELRPPTMTAKQRARYESILDGVARAWGLR